ncbi:MAG: hypothetical protein JNG82_14165 [Opitutaceae bacterium]|nr:hypothetical protein [Opitutaceae bacterium]
MSAAPAHPPAPFRLRSPLPAPRVRGRLLVITHRRDTLGGWLSKQQGLFSEFFAVLGALRYAERHGAAGVRVEFTSNLYRDPARGANWWGYYFAPLMWLGPARPDAPVVRADGWTRFGPHAWNDSWTSQIIPGNTNRRPYPLDSAADLREAARLTARHIRPQPELLAQLGALWTAHAAPADFVVGLHYRGTDKITAYPYRSPDYRLYAEQLDRVLARHQPKSWRVCVATDETEFIDWAVGRYGDRVFFQPSAPRLSSGDIAARRTGTHKNLALSASLKGETAVLDCLLLSRCHHLIKNRSSLSDASLAFNATLPWTFILGDGLIYESGAPG